MSEIFIAFLKLLLFPISIIIYTLSGFFYRNEKKIVFGAQKNSFTDNTMHLYLYVYENEKHLIPIWISQDRKLIKFLRSKGCKAHLRWSLKGFYHTATAKYWFIITTTADILHFTSKKATIINLWHGIPLKKIYFDSDNKFELKRYHNPNLIQKYVLNPHIYRLSDFMVSPSYQISKDSFSSALKVPIDKCLNLGLPRNDIFFYDDFTLNNWLDKWCSVQVKHVISEAKNADFVWLYMPTWRENNPNFLINLNIDFIFLNQCLKSKNEILVVKLHQYTPLSTLKLINNLSNILIYPTNEDIYPFLKFSDSLITDYSSIYIDYLLLNKPIYHFCFDLIDFQKRARSFYYDFDTFSAGNIILDIKGFYEIFQITHIDRYAEKRKKLIKYFFDLNKGNSSKLVTNFIKNINDESAKNNI
ncbi:MAG: CDP-glycerol glycerophosphotransferase family protein [Bacteroidota bacterium]